MVCLVFTCTLSAPWSSVLTVKVKVYTYIHGKSALIIVSIDNVICICISPKYSYIIIIRQIDMILASVKVFMLSVLASIM